MCFFWEITHFRFQPGTEGFQLQPVKNKRVVENAFGHLKARFRRIGKGLSNKIENTSNIITCCRILQNFCTAHNSLVPEKWKEDAELVQRSS